MKNFTLILLLLSFSVARSQETKSLRIFKTERNWSYLVAPGAKMKVWTKSGTKPTVGKFQITTDNEIMINDSIFALEDISWMRVRTKSIRNRAIIGEAVGAVGLAYIITKLSIGDKDPFLIPLTLLDITIILPSTLLLINGKTYKESDGWEFEIVNSES